MKQRIFSLSLLLIVSIGIMAGNRSIQEIKDIASRQLGRLKISKMHKAPSKADSIIVVIDCEQLAVVTSDVGFVVVAKNDEMSPILGYSQTSFTSDTLSLPDGLKWWLNEVSGNINFSVPSTAPQKSKQLKGAVDPLIKTHWNQTTPYNTYCPEDVASETTLRYQRGKRYQCPTGCIATAMAQILYYFQGLTHGTGKYGYNYVHNGFDNEKEQIIDVTDSIFFDFENTVFDWTNMIEDYQYYYNVYDNHTEDVKNYTDEQEKAIGLLMQACGVASRMKYGYNESSATITNCIIGLSRNFGYKYSSHIYQKDFNKDWWMNKIYTNISNGQPIIYAGYDRYGDEKGHTFLLDGYDSEGLVHINWGWGGSYDGYYNLSNLCVILNAETVRDYTSRHEMVCDLQAPNYSPNIHIVNVAKAGSLAQLLPTSEWESIEALKVTGEVGGSDFEVLRNLCGRDIHNNPTTYKLMSLDLSDIDIVDGDAPYMSIGTTNYYTYDDRFPAAAFNGCSGLLNIILPRSISRIEDGSGYGGWPSDIGAFTGCTGLKEIVIPEGVSWIGNHAFQGCTSLSKVLLPKSLNTIGRYVFYGCKALENIDLPDNLVTIGDGAFGSCTLLDNIQLPPNIDFLGGGIFAQCSSLKSIVIPDGVTALRASSFSGCSSLQSISLPSSVTTLDAYDYTYGETFKDCISLRNINLPSKLQRIPANTFEGCTSLERIVIPECVEKIDRAAFEGCTSLIDVQMGDMVKSIGDVAFFKCKSLNQIVIGDGVEKIGRWAFWSCPNLESVVLGKSITVSENLYDVFDRSALKSISVAIGNPNIDSRGNCNAVIETKSNKLIFGTSTSTVPESVVTIGKRSFGGNNISSIHIPPSVKTIEESAFADCQNLNVVEFSEGLESIGKSAFYGCKSLSNFQLPERLKNVSNGCFRQCSAIVCVSIPNSVIAIGDYAFEGCKSLSSLKIGDAVETISEDAFRNCPLLESVVLGKSVKTFKNAFCVHDGSYDGFYLKHISVANDNPYLDSREGINGVIETAEDKLVMAFADSNIPESVKIIGEEAYYLSKDLQKITFPQQLHTIEPKAFYGCEHLTEVVLPNSVVSIGKSAFENCYAMKRLELPDGIESIEERTFMNCKALNSLVLPGMIKSIGENAFGYGGLMKVTSFIKEPFPIGQYTFNQNFRKIALYVPRGSKALYEATNYWNLFSEIIEFDPTDVSETLLPKGPFDVYNLQGVKVKQNVISLDGLPIGIYVINGKKVICGAIL